MKWAVDAMLGDVARYMIILGEDVFYRADYSGETLVRIASEDDRIFLTTSLRRFPQPPCIPYLIIPSSACCVWEKLRFVKSHFSLRFTEDNLFSRCMLCNMQILEIHPDKKPDTIPHRVFSEFVLYQCPQCKKVYWKGGHFARTRKKLIAEHILDN